MRFSIGVCCGNRIRGALFLGKYAFFCFSFDLFEFSSFVSRYFGAAENFNGFSGGIFGAPMLCFPVFGERRAFSLGLFPSKLCSFVLVLPWCFVFHYLALFFFRLVGCFWRRLGLPLGCPGLVGPPWAGDRFCCFFGSPLCRPTWSHGFFPNAQKQMVLGLFMRKGQFAEIIASEHLCSEGSCFLEFFKNSGRRLLAQNGLVDANLEVSFGVSPVFSCPCFVLFGFSWARLG